MSYNDLLKRVGHINTNYIEARGRGAGIEAGNLRADFESRVKEMIEYCEKTDDKWINEPSLNFLESLEDKFSQKKFHLTEKQLTWLNRVWIRYSQL